jgi:hypothetical protein
MEVFLFSFVFPGIFIAFAIWKFGGINLSKIFNVRLLFEKESNNKSTNQNQLSQELRSIGKMSFGIALFLLIGIFQGIYMGRSRFLYLFNQHPILFILLSLVFLFSFPFLFFSLANIAEKTKDSNLKKVTRNNLFTSLLKDRKRNEAIKKLKEAKELRDSGIISNEEFISISNRYKPFLFDE